MSATNEHPIRPGITLQWGAGGFDRAPVAATGVPVFFVFSLVDGLSKTGANHMALVRGTTVATHSPPEPAPTFHVAVVLSDLALQELLAEDKTPGAARVRLLAAGEGEPVLALPLTPGARLAVESIRRCPFAGAIRAMALTARCNDLLFEFFTALAGTATPRVPPLTRNVTGRIHAAAEALKRDLETPPTLAVLARSVGLSETTLKRGFRQVFGTTVFGYLRERRMERARSLLQSGEATVLEAAARVGFSNPSNFAAAFRRQFGLNPKEFQLTARG
ncbi:MAG: helix-turn-helix transcriptional regulator [Verrucomicrobia bacterium]|nr:helix-turn-helix transcriptional regulator [Verrucomicrobiota bacterium]